MKKQDFTPISLRERRHEHPHIYEAIIIVSDETNH
jgi:hypothetical protein